MPKKIRSCRVCGCTDDDCSQCIAKNGFPCFWVEKDLCSACAEVEEQNELAMESLASFNKMFEQHFVVPDPPSRA